MTARARAVVVDTARDAAWVAAVVVALLVPTALAGLDGARPDTPLRHAYLIPVTVAAVRWGFSAGVASGLVAAALAAPVVLSHVEREGMTRAGIEGLVTLLALILAGGVSGALAGAAARERTHHRLLLALQRTLATEEAIAGALERLRGELAARLAADIALVVRDGEQWLRTGPEDLASHPTVARVLATGGTAFVPDVAGAPRPRRLAVVPVTSRDGVIGALAVARFGEIGAGERAAAAALGAWIGLALENARLAARQRRFADELDAKVATVRQELASLARAKSAFVATASHELRTPLTALRGFSELLARRRYPSEDVQRFAGILSRETERLARLVEDLLDLSRLEQGLDPPLRRTALAVASALETAVALFTRDGATHPVVVECDASVPVVHADPDALDRILKNLVSNAIKYSPPGEVRVVARVAGDAVEIAVVDRGRGIAPDAVPRLFEPWFRADDTAQMVPGAGIGLAVVKALVEAHGGTIAVESAPGTGTRIAFTMPIARA